MADVNPQQPAPRRAAPLRHGLIALVVLVLALLTATGIASAGTGGVSPPSGGAGTEDPPPDDGSPPEEEGDGGGGVPLEVGDVRPQRLFFDGKRPAAEFSYEIGGVQAKDLTIEVVNRDTDQVVRSYEVDDVPPGQTLTQKWKGKDADGEVVADGPHRFRVSERNGPHADASEAEGDRTFDFYGHKFPIRGPHDYGGSGSRFGAARSGHTHQGQDVAASCGTRLVAARGGKVKVKAYQAGGAGNYVVVNLKESDRDQVYMHLRKPASVDRRENIDTGQKIGEVGTTGSSTGCHLHFEIWTGPGWFDGGHPIDPLSDLKYWDSYS